jgi:hypothetical protein
MARQKRGSSKKTSSREPTNSREPKNSRELRNSREAPRFNVSVSSRSLPLVLIIAALVLLACHAAIFLYHYRVAELHWLVRQLFDVDQENNLPTWYSQFLLLLASVLLWVCARQKASQGASFSGYWTTLAVGFLLMSVDEVAGVHESINSAIVVTWAIPAAFGALIIGLAFVPFLLQLPRMTALLFSVAGALYLTGALGAEIVGNDMVRNHLQDTLRYKMATMGEESLEMAGLILFLYALLRYMGRPGDRTVRASLEVE